MTPLGPDARALLDAASNGDEPSADDAARVRAKLTARLAVGAAAGAAATAAAGDHGRRRRSGRGRRGRRH
ncbi:MAG: hypothetical protein KF764_20075 [Labilithrix sp.]|nr:hypothetical protein [Labilithrix sp.]